MWTSLTLMAARVRAFFRSRSLDRDFDEELQAHLAMLAEGDGEGLPALAGQGARGDGHARRAGAQREARGGRVGTGG